jgi:hypothetical protein
VRGWNNSAKVNPVIDASSLRQWVLAAGLGLLATSATQAQTMYRCGQGSSVRWSDKPCPVLADTKIGYYGAAQHQPTPAYTTLPQAGRAAEHLAYLSQPCAELNDAIRTAPARGLKSTTVGDLMREYQQKCSEDDQAARQRLQQDRNMQRDLRQAQVSTQQAEINQARTARDLCDQQLRNLAERRKRQSTMSEGEQADLRRFEASYAERCR